MPAVALDFSWTHPDVAELVANEVKAILFYSRVSTPDRGYLDAVVAAGIGACPIFETAATRPWDGYGAGVSDGNSAAGDLDRIGVPDGVRLYVNLSDTPNVGGHEEAITEYARGFAESFPTRWKLGGYGPLAALRAAQGGSSRFDALWAVETWGSPSGSPQQHYDFFTGQPGVVLVQMANIPPPIAGTDTNWIIGDLGAWGATTGDDMPNLDELDAYLLQPVDFQGHPDPNGVSRVGAVMRNEIKRALDTLAGWEQDTRSQIIAALHALPTTPGQPLDPKALAAAIADALGTVEAKKVADELAARLAA